MSGSKKLIATGILLLSGLSQGCWRGYSQGDRVGIPFKLSYKGLFCKTWEGSMNLGGMQAKGDGSFVPNVWNFTLEGENIEKFRAEIQTAIDTGERLKVSYDQEAFPVCDSDDGYFVTNVEVLK